ncbi:MAG: diguanylate cyclase (GGDEF)-like protein/PAS domain S-box-containing protein, partial [Halieaceae bacterium]
MDSMTLLIPGLLLIIILLSALGNIRRQNDKIASLLEQTSQKLETSEEELRLVASTFDSHEPIVITDASMKILRVNDAFCQVTGFVQADAVGADFGLIAQFHSDLERQDIIDALNVRGRYNGEIDGANKNGDLIPMLLRATAIRNDAEVTTHFVVVYSDISEQKRNEEVINSLAFFDPLTGLPNRRKIMDSIDRELYLSSRYQYSGALFFIDIDNFKNINDTLGHDHGDRLLIELGQRLCSQVRKSDTVSRLGGDEFLVLLQGESSTEQETINHATSMASKLLSFHQDPYYIEGHKHFVTISIGITTFPGHASEPQELLKQADIALYKAKSMGRNTSCFFH